VKYTWIEEHRGQFSITRMCRLLGVSRTGYCQWRGRGPSARAIANSVLDVKVAAIHAESGRSYGRERIVRKLHKEGSPVGHERVRQSLQRQKLRPVYRRPYRVTTDSNHANPVAPNILDRRFTGWAINAAWVGDISYIATDEGWLYLAVIIDLASRRVVGWSMSERMKADLVCEALKSAYWRRKPGAGLIMHTDRGSQYASRAHRRLLADYGMVQSMSRLGNCWDNSVAESFFKTLKVERAYQVRYASRAQARLDLINWIEGFYNSRRLHSSINFHVPNDLEKQLEAA
jgi:transposase InsO family protein